MKVRCFECDAWAEASERLTGGTERLAEIGDVTVHPVTEDRVGD